MFEKRNPFNPSNPCSKHSPVNVKKDRQKKYQPCFVPFLTVINTFSAIFSKKYFLLNVIPPFHLAPIITLIISGLYMVELRWNYGRNYMKFHPYFHHNSTTHNALQIKHITTLRWKSGTSIDIKYF